MHSTFRHGTCIHLILHKIVSVFVDIMHYKKYVYTINIRTKKLLARCKEISVHPRKPILISAILGHLYLRLEMILVTACLMMTPAFSVSFLVSPLVMQTLRAGIGCHPASLGLTPSPSGKAFSLVMRTPFARHCDGQL